MVRFESIFWNLRWIADEVNAMISPWDAAHPNSTAAKKAFTEIRGERSIRQLSIKNGGQLVNFFYLLPI